MEAYAQDEQLFFKNFAKAFVKVSETAQDGKLLSEFDSSRNIDGGYVEESRLNRFMLVLRAYYSAYMTDQSAEEWLELEESREEQKQIEQK